MQQPTDARIALLIDADNAPSGKIDVILAELAKFGVVNIRRAYGNWKNPRIKGWEEVLHEYAIRPIQQFDYTKGKNATDAAMTIDAMDLLYSQQLDAFALVSSDSDFTPLVMRILTNGIKVYGFGEKKTPMPFVNACSTFLYVENLSDKREEERHPEGPARRFSGAQMRQDAKLVNLLRGAVEGVAEDDGWSNLAKVANHIANHTSFDPRNYGYRKLSELLESTDLFDGERRSNHTIFIRDRQARKQARPDQRPDQPVQARTEPAPPPVLQVRPPMAAAPVPTQPAEHPEPRPHQPRHVVAPADVQPHSASHHAQPPRPSHPQPAPLVTPAPTPVQEPVKHLPVVEHVRQAQTEPEHKAEPTSEQPKAQPAKSGGRHASASHGAKRSRSGKRPPAKRSGS